MNKQKKQEVKTSNELQWVKTQIIKKMIVTSESGSLESKTKLATYIEIMKLIEEAKEQDTK